MVRKDYIIRLIEEFGVLWEQLVVQIRDGDHAVAQLTLDRTFQRLFGMSSQKAHELSAGAIMARLHLGVTPEDGRSQCWMATTLLVGQAQLAMAAGQRDIAHAALQKARDLTAVLCQYDPEIPTYAHSLAELDTALASV
jgi:hypothetical protein